MRRQIQDSWTDELDIDHLQRLLADELKIFRREAVDNPRGELVELSGLAIAWLLVFMSEIASPQFVSELEAVVIQFRARSTYKTEWHATLGLDAALFAATHNDQWLDSILANVDHENPTLRYGVIDALALIAPLTFLLREPILAHFENAILEHNFYFNDLIAAVVVSRGAAQDKLAWVSQLLDRYAKKSWGIPLDPARDLSSGNSVVNPLAIRLGRITNYVLLRLSSSTGPPRQLTLFPTLSGHAYTPPRTREYRRLLLARRRGQTYFNVPLPPLRFGSVDNQLRAAEVWNRLSHSASLAPYISLKDS